MLWVHNSQAKTRQQRRIRVKLQAAYHPIGRDPKKLQELGTPPGDSIWIENRYVSGHHCSIVRVGKKQRYELRDWQKGQWGTYRQNPWWKRLLTRRKFTQVQRNIVLKDGDRLVLADPKDPKKRFVRLRFVHPPVWWVRMLRWGAYGAGAGVAAATGAVGFAVYTVRDVQIEPLPSVPVPMAIYASNGQTLMAGGIGTRHEDAESLAQVPELLWRSLLLSEDQQYFWHPGVNPIRVMTTAIRNRLGGRVEAGASTLTMQLARTLFLYEVNAKDLWGVPLWQKLEAAEEAGEDVQEIENPQALQLTPARKIREAGLALRLDWHYDKQTLLLAYINSVDLGYRELTGEGIRGFSDASLFYFNKPLESLSADNPKDIARIANLVALARAPRVAYGVCETRTLQDEVLQKLQESQEKTPEAENLPVPSAEPEPELTAVEIAIEDVVYLVQVRNTLVNLMVRKGLVSPELGEQAKQQSNYTLFANEQGFCERRVDEDQYYEETPLFLSSRIRDEVQQVLHLNPEPEAQAWGLNVFDNLIVETSLDVEKQQTAERMLNQTQERLWREKGVPHGALISLDSNTGEIKTLVGEVVSPDGLIFDYSAQEQLPPGSTFKTFFYVTALQKGMTLEQRFPCESLSWLGEVFPVAEYSRYCGSGLVSDLGLPESVASSDNLVPLKVVQQFASLEAVAETAKLMGILSPLEPLSPRMAFGLHRVNLREMAAAYAVLANGGLYNAPHAITRIRANVNQGECDSSPEKLQNCPVIYEYRQDVRAGLPVLSREVAEQMTTLLQGVVLPGGTGTAAFLGVGEAGKTGTSDQSQDGWFVGYVPGEMTTAVWLGNFIQPSLAVLPGPAPYFSSSDAAELWGEFMGQCRGAAGCVPPEDMTSVDAAEAPN